MYRQALEVKIEVLGAEHIDVANTQNNIGLLLQAQGNLPEALKMYEKAFKTCVAVLGPEHLQVVNSCSTLPTSLYPCPYT